MPLTLILSKFENVRFGKPYYKRELMSKRLIFLIFILSLTISASGCRSVGAGAYVGRNEFDRLTQRVDYIDGDVQAIKTHLGPLSPARAASTSGSSPAKSDDPFNVLFSGGDNAAASGLNPPAGTAAAATGGLIAATGDERSSYQRGQSLLKQKQYDKAAAVFLHLLEQNPRSSLAPNSRYWLGECFYATGRFSEAAVEFQTCADDYPQSDKAPDSLLKLSYCYSQMGDGPRAMAVMDILLSNYPKSSSAELVRSGKAKFNGA